MEKDVKQVYVNLCPFTIIPPYRQATNLSLGGMPLAFTDDGLPLAFSVGGLTLAFIAGDLLSDHWLVCLGSVTTGRPLEANW